MRPTPDKMRAFMAQLKKKMNLKSLVVTLAAIVVFTTTYLLILPAFTLDKEEAAEQGGIDVAVEQTVETVDEEAPAEKAEEPAAAQEESAEAVTETEESAAKEEVKEETASPKQNDSAAKEEKEEVGLLSKKKELTAEKEKTDDFTISAVVDKDAKVPEDVFLEAKELTKDTEGFDYDKYYKDALKALKKDSDDVKGIKSIKFYDISLEAESQDESVEPEAAVNVKIAYDDGVKVDDAENVRVIHFAEQKNGEEKAEVLDTKENKVETTTAANGSKLTEASFETEGFSVFAVAEMELTTEFTLTNEDGNTNTHLVTVTYGPEAKIPEGATLDVTTLTAYSKEYKDAWEAVVSDKKNKDKEFDEEDLGFAALDITIRDSQGNPVEPEEDAEVKVSIKLNKLPEGVSEDILNDSLEIQHLNETKGLPVVETVAEPQDVIVTDGTAEAVFTVNSFSTYTITWTNSRGTNNNNARMRFATGNNNIDVRIYYADENGTAITRARNDFTASPNPGNNTTTNYALSEDLIGAIQGWEFVQAYYDEAHTQPITDIQISRGTAVPGTNVRSIAFYNNETQVGQTVSGGTVAEQRIYVVYRNEGNSITVHFVDRNGTELTEVKDSEGNVIDSGSVEFTTSGETIDFSTFTKTGYTYSNTLLKSKSNTGTSLDYYETAWSGFRYNNGNFQGTTGSVDEGGNFYNRNYQDGDEIYVIFDPTPTGGSGGGGGGTTPISDLPDPETSKTLTDNKDGTYDLNLSITGKADSKEENKNINVLFVIDSSSSMGDINSSTSRIGRTKTDVITSAETLLKNNTQAHPDLVQVAAVSFDNKAYDVSDWTTSLDTFRTNINDTTKLTTHTGTNWEAGFRKALEFGTGDGDPTYVIYFTDGMPQGYILQGNTNNYQSANSHYLDMAAANDEARAIVNSGVTVYGIFAYGSTSDNNRDLLGRQIDYAYNDTTSRATYYKTAADSDDVSQALAEIVDAIAQSAGFTNVVLKDGITGLTHTTLVHGTVGEFRYYRSGGTNTDGTEKYDHTANDGRGVLWTGAPEASYSSSTGVTWNLGDLILEDGVKYTVSFTVWPDQDAYDTVAEINNTDDPEAAYNALDQTIKDQIQFDEATGKCSLKTNTEATASYTTIKTSTETKLPNGAVAQSDGTWKYTDSTGKVWTYVKNEDGTYTGTTTQNKSLTYNDVPAISLDKTTMKVKKVWEDDLTNASDRPLSVTFTIKEDNETYQTITLSGEGQVWEQEINIAPGIYVTPGTHDTDATGDAAGVLEGAEGHVYSVAETGYTYKDKNGNIVSVDGVENHYELEAPPVKPMLNGTTTTDKEDMIEYLTKTVWTAGNAALTATNTVKDGIYIYKKVVSDGEEIDCDQEFTFKVSLKDAEGNPVYVNKEEADCVSGDLAWRIDVADESSSSGYSEDERGFYRSPDGIVTLTMKADGRIRVVNVPAGTTFTVEEVTASNPGGYEYLNSQVNDEAATTDNKATGTTVGNKQWATTITNKLTGKDVELIKIDGTTTVDENGNLQEPTPLANVKFILKNNNGSTDGNNGKYVQSIANGVITWTANKDEAKEFTTGTDGKIEFGMLPLGSYLMTETEAAPGYNLLTQDVAIVISPDRVTYTVEGQQKNAEKIEIEGTEVYQMTIPNNCGPELPMTGGIGTTIFYILGSLLVVGCGIMLISRRRTDAKK